MRALKLCAFQTFITFATMRIAIFFICVCYLLFGGYNYLYTGKHRASYSTSLHIEKNHQSKFTDKKQGYPIIKEANAGQNKANLVADIEDEDTNDPTARKLKLLVKLLYALSYSFLLTWLYSRFKTLRPCAHLLFCKYITLRVLRI
jgi:cbb3-type cytochrome oxidase subunit 3